MISIHIGVLTTEDLSGTVEIVKNTQDYVLTRQRIHEALSREEDLEIFVLARVYDDWFWDLLEYYDDIRLIDDAPTERLKLKLSINALPADLVEKPELIIKLGLLNLPNPQKSIDDVWGWIIENKLGAVWINEIPSPEHLSELMSWFLENAIDPILESKVTEITRQWINTASGRLRSAYARFMENPQLIAYSLITWKALTPYNPQLREEWLAAEGWYSHKLEDLAEVIKPSQQLPKSIRSKLNPKLRTYWNTQLKDRFNE